MDSKSTTEVGAIARIRYSSPNGYVVLQMERHDFSVFTAVGTMPEAAEGVQVSLIGEWKEHKKFGEQFSFVAYEVPTPTDEQGMVAYLSTLKGVGEGLAARMIAHFGLDEVIEVLEHDSDRLLEVQGIGSKTLPKIVESFKESKGLRTLISFLAEVGVSATYAPRIYKVYGSAAIAEIKRDPYILAEEVRGFGFKKADEVALKMGIAPDSQVRAIAGIMHCLKSAANLNGHCYLPQDKLTVEACGELALPDYRPQMSDIEGIIERLKLAGKKQRLVVDGDRVYQAAYFDAEVDLARKIRQMAGATTGANFNLQKWIAEYEAENGLELSDGQKTAIWYANTNGLTVMTGGAGVGKTSVAKAVIASWHKQGKRVIACAPTGKAAQRIREATGLMSASTIHRLLGWNGYGFDHDEDNPLEGDAFLIDEFSMTDLRLANALFQAIPPHAIALIVGDVNQLPSVGAGNVLRDIIESAQIPVVRLTETFRQAKTSRIIQASLAINEGQFPLLEQISRSSGVPQSDALWVKCPATRIPEAISWLLTDKLPSMGWQQDDIQVLSPMHRGDIGNIALNALIQNAWNPAMRGEPVMGDFRMGTTGDRVIQTSNDYDKKVFNGDIGKIEVINTTEKEVEIRFPDLDNPDGRVVTYSASDLDNIMLAYSISIHKCVKHSERVSTTGRGVVPISDLDVGELIHTGGGQCRKVVGKFPTGKKKIVRVSTKSGYTIDVSREHPLLVATSDKLPHWVKAEDVGTEHYACIDRTQLHHGVNGLPELDQSRKTHANRQKDVNVPTTLTPEIAWLLGVIIGDGYCNDKTDGRIEISSNILDKDVSDRAKSLVESFGINVTERTHGTKGMISIYWHSVPFRNWLCQLGLEYLTARDKKTPSCIFTADLPCRAAYIRGLFDTDGSFSKGGDAVLVSSSVTLIDEVRHLLLTCGVASRTEVRAATNSKALYVNRAFMKDFESVIGFWGDRKNQRMKSRVIPKTFKTTLDIIPFGALLIDEFKSLCTRSNSELYGKKQMAAVSMILHGKCNMNYRHLRELLVVAADQNVQCLSMDKTLATNYFYDQIKSIEFLDEETEMYDIEVEGIHSFVANGFVCHNSQGSEFPVVVIPIAMSQYRMLQRNLLYTGLTRGKKLVVLVGEEQAIAMAVRTQNLNQRNTALAERIGA